MADVSKVEVTKIESKALRGNIASELFSSDSGFGKGTTDLIKFHGMYQQDDRDARKGSKEKAYSLMIRGRIPGGRLTAKQYVIWDDVASKYSNNNSLRLTTRQSIQLHGVLKSDIKATIQEINTTLQSTQGACGDVVRNVTQAENPLGDKKLSQLDVIADQISDHFLAKSTAYAEIWLDGEQVNKEETLYGETYLPRKFKIALTAVGNNSVDLFTNDLGIAATFDSEENIDGYFIFAGGGMGMTHKKPSTFPRIASELGWVPKDKLIGVSESIISVHRDYGNRKDRKNARLKYIIADQGVQWFREIVESRSKVVFEKRTLPLWETPNLLGWHKASNGSFSYGLHLTAGRISDTEKVQLKSGLRHTIEKFNLNIQVTADQDLLLLNISEEDRANVEANLRLYGIVHQKISEIDKRALACVALPTCGLAITEAERALTSITEKLDQLLEKYGLQSKSPVFRITGCPNGCARPYAAELAFVGRSKNAYSIFAGGSAEGDRIAPLLFDNVKEEVIFSYIESLFKLWRNEGTDSEKLGDFVYRLSNEVVAEKIEQSVMQIQA